MGISAITALREAISTLETTLCIDMKPADWKTCKEPWESLFRKWINFGKSGLYKYSPTWESLLGILSLELDQEELSQRIDNFLGGKWGWESLGWLVKFYPLEENQAATRYHQAVEKIETA